MVEQAQVSGSRAGGDRLKGKILWIPRMSYGGARTFAAAFRSIGVNARECPDADMRAMELGSRVTSGDECYPEMVTLGTFLRLAERPEFDPAKEAFFMPTAGGPCRFGQYAPFVRKVLDDVGLANVDVFAPTSADGYKGVGGSTGELMRTAWRALVVSDLLRKFLHKTRPYEKTAGDADQAHEDSLSDMCGVLQTPGMQPKEKLAALVDAMTRCRDRFRAVPADYSEPRPLIGVVGEIFCRLNTFSNEDFIRRIEAQGGEGWLSDITEWVWYTNFETFKRIRRAGKQVSLQMLGAVLKNKIQRADEHAILDVVEEDLAGYNEPHGIKEVLDYAMPYLPHDGALGEMVLSVGKAIYLYEHGADGIVDISPFTCMNGITCEAVYPRVSKEHDHIPIKNFYFDGTQKDLDTGIGIFLELARTYRRRKKPARRLPPYFPAGVKA
jgi:predicted nucleotide-binding protein (sugar kinase/HSP70/actin superfamily)